MLTISGLDMDCGSAKYLCYFYLYLLFHNIVFQIYVLFNIVLIRGYYTAFRTYKLLIYTNGVGGL